MNSNIDKQKSIIRCTVISNSKPLTQKHLLFISYIFLASIVVLYSIFIDRTNLLDYDAYLNYFINPSFSNYIETLFNTQGAVGKIAFIFTEEIIWRIYVSIIGFIFSPSVAVTFTAVLINVLLVFTFLKLQHKLLALILWILIPAGLFTLGTFQLRQGLAFAVFAYLAVVFCRPLMGALLAAMIHTTFFIPFVFLLLHVAFKNKFKYSILSSVFISLLGTSIGGQLFEHFGGRRVLVYAIDEGANSINYVIGAIVYVLPTLYLILRYQQHGDKNEAIWLMHTSVVVWVISSFFFFPLGTLRIGYYISLFFILSISATWRLHDKIHSILILLAFVLILWTTYKTL